MRWPLITFFQCIIPVANTKALISFAVTAQLFCAFGSAYAHYWFSDAFAQFYYSFAKTHQTNS